MYESKNSENYANTTRKTQSGTTLRRKIYRKDPGTIAITDKQIDNSVRKQTELVLIASLYNPITLLAI